MSRGAERSKADSLEDGLSEVEGEVAVESGISGTSSYAGKHSAQEKRFEERLKRT